MLQYPDIQLPWVTHAEEPSTCGHWVARLSDIGINVLLGNTLSHLALEAFLPHYVLSKSHVPSVLMMTNDGVHLATLVEY